ncbi:hypothetical protein [Hyalangium rubrum]|uniref:Uncharacterized protein n=1 Tax=Hyalangium rubrum TaxID=3103134 RepID=A0ABU5GVX2_9BACT|nr:hypothetical protein [Hyalangium sp. s54d21]MDY7225330.1 hypothetical protein [Hyalangium sp. s54d21]
MSERQGAGWSGSVYGNHPVQGDGRVDGHAWYFRAKWAAWSMEIVEDTSISPEVMPVVGPEHPGWLVEEDWGTSPEASRMDDATAWQLIEQTIARFRRGELPYIRPEPL